MATKVTTDMIRPFTGDGDIFAWLKKVKLVAKLQKITDVASFLPLFLEGDALALYLELDESEQATLEKIEEKLKFAFTDSKFTAYNKLVAKKWNGEQVDVFSNEIRRLGELAGFNSTGLDNIVKLTFINGFPESISVNLQQVTDIMTLKMSDIIARARILTANVGTNYIAVVKHERYDQGPRNETVAGKSSSFRDKCFKCDGPRMGRNRTRRTTINCFKCGRVGHIARYCNNNNSGNSNRGIFAPEITPIGEQGRMDCQ